MSLTLRLLRLAATLLVAAAVAFGALPIASASAAPVVQSRTTSTASETHDAIAVEGARNERAARRASYAWTGSRIYYRETVAAKWDWSLQTAISKWNHSGAKIHFVRTTSRKKAQLTISSANIGPAAGMATVGRVRKAYVHLSNAYADKDELDAHYRIEVMMVFTHELGHVLGFQHTSAPCSLMSPMLDVEGCNVIPRVEMPGYYKCRTINGSLAARFVKVYGGKATFPASWCPIDKIPSPLTDVDITGGPDSPTTINWASPTSVPSGARVKISSWQSDTCDAVPTTAASTYAAVADGTWQDPQAEPAGNHCFRVQLVNRYDAGQTAVARVMAF
jgi:matrixin